MRSDIIFDQVEDPHVPSGDIPPRLSPSPLRPDSAEMKMVGVAAGTSMKKTLIMWSKAQTEKIRITRGLLLWRTLEQRPTKRK